MKVLPMDAAEAESGVVRRIANKTGANVADRSAYDTFHIDGTHCKIHGLKIVATLLKCPNSCCKLSNVRKVLGVTWLRRQILDEASKKKFLFDCDYRFWLLDICTYTETGVSGGGKEVYISWSCETFFWSVTLYQRHIRTYIPKFWNSPPGIEVYTHILLDTRTSVSKEERYTFCENVSSAHNYMAKVTFYPRIDIFSWLWN